MKQAYDQAGISADQITYVEAHGTGTPVGDPIEARAIGERWVRREVNPYQSVQLKVMSDT
ncbi:MAG: hypothetical protein LRY63_05560 [Nitrincola sp.]|nr:hypothetical protein [Nitrincola sp.]